MFGVNFSKSAPWFVQHELQRVWKAVLWLLGTAAAGYLILPANFVEYADEWEVESLTEK